MNLFIFSGLVIFIFFIYVFLMTYLSLKQQQLGRDQMSNTFMFVMVLILTFATSLIIYGVYFL